MDVEFEIGGYAFEWDDEKAAQVPKQHGVDFQDAARLWSEDQALLETLDPYPHEERFRVLGQLEGVVLFVVYTEREEGRLRLITARAATTNEQIRYRTQSP